MNTETGDLYKRVPTDEGEMWIDETGVHILRLPDRTEPITEEQYNALGEVPKEKRPSMLKELRTFERMQEARRKKVRSDPRTALRNERQRLGKIRGKKDQRKKRKSRRDRKRNKGR